MINIYLNKNEEFEKAVCPMCGAYGEASKVFYKAFGDRWILEGWDKEFYCPECSYVDRVDPVNYTSSVKFTGEVKVHSFPNAIFGNE